MKPARRVAFPGFAAIILLTIPLLTGCLFGMGTGEVEGVLLINGQPASGFEVRFTSIRNPNQVAMGIAREGGKFRLSRGRGVTRIPPGEYKVTLTPVVLEEGAAISEVALPETYTELEQATLVVTVSSGQNTLTIEVTADQSVSKPSRKTAPRHSPPPASVE